MRTILISTMLALMLAAPAASALSLDAEETLGASTATRWIVGFHEFPGLEPGDSYEGARVVDATPELRFVVVETASFAVFEARANLDENVRYVETDVSDHELLFVPNDYFYNHAAGWGTKRVGAETAWDKTLGTTSVKVAMIDSGLNKGHEEYAGQSRVLQGWDFRDGDNNPEDTRGCSWHGTHTTGTAGATINNGKGFAGLSQHSILPIKIFGKGFGGCGAATTSNIANAIKYAGDQGAHASSNSWGGGSYSTAINDAIVYSHNKGVIHVAAAGNDGCTNCIGNPWKPVADITLIVSASDSSDNLASFSSTGPEVDLIAPGVYIGSSTSGTGDYHAMDGTSMACPHVTGTVALVKALNPSYTFSQVESRLKGTAIDLGLSASQQGSGLVNAAGAVY